MANVLFLFVSTRRYTHRHTDTKTKHTQDTETSILQSDASRVLPQQKIRDKRIECFDPTEDVEELKN